MPGTPPRVWVTLAAIAAAAIAVRVPFFHVPMISDEGGYLYVAKFWSGSYQLYRDIPFDRPQGIFLIYKAILAVLGGDVWALRLAAALWNAGTAVALFFLARDVLASQRLAVVASLVFAVCSTSPHIEGFTANAELFALLPLVVAAHLTWQQRWASAGLLSGLAVLIKPIGLSGFLLVVIWLALRRAGWRSLLASGFAFAAAPLASLAHAYWIDWTAFVEAARLKWSSDTIASQSFSTQANLFAASALRTLPAWLAAAVAAAAGWSTGARDARRFGLAWIFASLAGMAIGGHWSWHYWTQLIPALALLSPLVLRRASGTRAGRLVMLPCALALVLFVQVEAPLWWRAPNDVSWAIYQRPGYLVQDDIASYIARETNPADLIYVAFAEAAIYPLANRRASVPYLYWYAIDGSQAVYEAAAASVTRREPAVVVWINDPPPQRATRAEFGALLQEADYRLDRSFGAIGVYRR